MRYAFFHHFVFSFQCQTMIHSEITQEPVEKASKQFTKLAVIRPNFCELLHIYVVAR